MATVGEPRWTTTIIISTSLQNHETVRMLTAQQHRIRLSYGVERGSFIFPLAGVAFMLVEPQDVPSNLEESGLIEQIKKFSQVHRNCFVLLYAPFNGKKEVDALSLIQQRFFGSTLRILPVRNSTEILKGILTIAKATSKPHVDRIRDRMTLARAHILERSPVWEMLRKLM
ncbi:protein SPO16 homolog [Dunckerocampus dactyliophorus]|uniref:protein SPO16 homolog n=1 Tax=Dunckerocampus dactyliophorus TaxID=161453 RepID=UPI00240571C9|nr:protein SPO16 homolog [Dunckerocampus dactyliophorus]